MKYLAKLIIGVDYEVMGVKFTKDSEVEIGKDLHDYLKSNPQFEVSESAPAKIAHVESKESFTKPKKK
jgi:alanine-alpha-ketoisovalerate/valine-pyruvate aminotransferase